MRITGIIVSLACVMLASGCASHRAAVRCDRRLEPINTPAPVIKATRNATPAAPTQESPAEKRAP